MEINDSTTTDIAAAALAVLEGKVDEAALSAKKRLDMYKKDYGIDAHGMKDAKEAEKVIRFMFTTQKDLMPEQMKALVDAGFFKEGIKQNEKLRRTTANTFGNNAWIQEFDYKAFMKKNLKEEAELDEARKYKTPSAAEVKADKKKDSEGASKASSVKKKQYSGMMGKVKEEEEEEETTSEVAEPEAQGEKDFKAKHVIKKSGEKEDGTVVKEKESVCESCGKVHEGACSEEVDESVMSDFHQMVKEKMPAEKIAKELGIDVKTVKKLMKGMNEESDKQKKYQAFFKKALKKFGVDSPQDLEKDKRAEFFDYVDANYEADNETD